MEGRCSLCGMEPVELYSHVCSTKLIESFLDRAKREEANKVSNPPHYQGGIQPLEFFLANPQLSFIQCNIIKYVFRYKQKNGIEDLKKAQFYLNLIIEQEQNNVKSL